MRRGGQYTLHVVAFALAMSHTQHVHATTFQEYDVLIRGGRVLDGTGNPWFQADVGIVGNTIVAIGRLSAESARHTIDASGKTVVPGFVDLHSHADGPAYGARGLRSDDPKRRSAPNLVAQGITTVLVNHDGRSLWPIAEQITSLIRKGTGPNVGVLVGHGTVRGMVMGDDFRRVATQSEIDSMRVLVKFGMEQGAFGMSSGLEYVPGRWSDTREVMALVRELAPYRGIYVTHERSSGADPMWYLPSSSEVTTTLLDAVAETIAISERTGVTAVQTHIKARGANYWGSSRAAIQLIERARRRGVNIYADHYPYSTTGSDGSTVLIPAWATRNGDGPRSMDTLRRVLADSASAERLRTDIAHEIIRRGDAENIVVLDFPDSNFIGKTIVQLAQELNETPVEVAIFLQMTGYADRRGGASLRGYSLSEIDVEAYARQPWMATATDGWVALPEDGLTHVRVYGTFPRKIAHYARDRQVLTVANAVRSATSLPAQIMGIPDRGLLRAGMKADVAILDLALLRDNATLFEPHQYPSGVDYVLINGQIVVEHGVPNGTLAGAILTPSTR